MKVCKIENFISTDLSFHIFKECFHNSVQNPYYHETHIHEFAEIVYILEGKCTQTINGINYQAKRGDMFFMNRNCTHSFSCSSDFIQIGICFSPESVVKRVIDIKNATYLLSLSFLNEIQGESTPIGKFVFEGEDRIWFESLLNDMLSEYKSNEEEKLAVLEGYMTVLIVKIVRKIRNSHVDNRKGLSEVWQALADFIDENLNQKLSLEDLAQKCFYNPSYFSRTFKQKFGISPVEYIARERSHMAASLIAQDPSLSMEDVAEKCGFGDKSGLYRSFEKFYGCTPTEYKKSIKKK